MTGQRATDQHGIMAAELLERNRIRVRGHLAQNFLMMGEAERVEMLWAIVDIFNAKKLAVEIENLELRERLRLKGIESK